MPPEQIVSARSQLPPMRHRVPPRRTEFSDVLFRIGGTLAAHVLMGVLIQLLVTEVFSSWLSWSWVLLALVASLLTAWSALLTAKKFRQDRLSSGRGTT